jgi:hypothetical protein
VLCHSIKAELLLVSAVLYGCETWSLTVREEHRLRVFENGVLREEVTGKWRNCVVGSFMSCTVYQILFLWPSHDPTAMTALYRFRYQSDIPQSVGLLWTSDQPVAQTCN